MCYFAWIKGRAPGPLDLPLVFTGRCEMHNKKYVGYKFVAHQLIHSCKFNVRSCNDVES